MTFIDMPNSASLASANAGNESPASACPDSRDPDGKDPRDGGPEPVSASRPSETAPAPISDALIEPAVVSSDVDNSAAFTRHASGWLLLCVGFCLTMLPLSPWRSTSKNSPSQNLSSSERNENGFPRLAIDINRAEAAELSCLPGIGPKIANRIVEYRREHGPFKSSHELLQVPGVGPRLVEKLMPSAAQVQGSTSE